MPAGSLGWHLDCAENPLDLRPAADLILRAIDERRTALPAGTPLVVLMGEDHLMPTHKELQHLVAKRLRQRGERFTVNFEEPHDFWAKIATKNMSICPPPGLEHMPGAYDMDGAAVLSSILGFDRLPLLHSNIMAFCYHSRVNAGFNDAARNGYDLDLKNPLTAAMAAEHFQQTGQTPAKNYTPCQHPIGMAIRNRFMAKQALRHAEQHQAPLILQQTGGEHIFGHESKKYLYQDSLCARFRLAGAAVLPVFLTSVTDYYGLNVLPAEAHRELPHSVVIDGLAESEFGNEAAERSFLADIHAASGHELDFYDVAGQKADYESRALRHAADLLAAYAAQNPASTPTNAMV